MDISIRNFRGIRSADITLAPIALVCAPNAAGKSSIAQAVAAALTGETVPVSGIKKSEAGVMIHAGQLKGSISVKTEAGKVTISYPKATAVSEGSPPAATVYAAGLRHFVELNQKDASQSLNDYLDAEPSFDDVKAALPELPESQLTKLWQTIEDLGWDGAHARAKETGIKLKGRWEHCTSERYGPAKAVNWLPPDWDPEVEGMSEESLQAQLTEAREWLEAAIATTAVGAAEREELQGQANWIPAIEKKIAETAEAMKKESGVSKSFSKELQLLPQPVIQDQTVVCPHCNNPVIINAGQLIKSVEVDDAENNKRQDAINSVQKKLDQSKNQFQSLEKESVVLENQYKAAVEAKERLAADSEATENEADTEAAREAVNNAHRRLESFRSWSEANRIQKSIEVNQDVVAKLAQNGLRLAALQQAITEFNEQLRWYSDQAGWGAVKIEEDLSVLYDERPYILLSESEKFRVRVVMQVAFSVMDESAAMVVDAADMLDKKGRNGLFKLLIGCQIRALICMTMNSEFDAPDIASKNIGISYWIDDHVARSIK